MGLYGDIKVVQEHSDDYFGAGFSLIADRTAIYNVNQNILSLYGSYHKALNADRKQYLSAGLNFGIAQRNVNYEEINILLAQQKSCRLTISPSWILDLE